MTKKLKKDLSITLGVNATVLIATFAVFAIISNYFLETSAEMLEAIPWLIILVIFGMAIGLFLVVATLPLLITAIVQLIFIPILLPCNEGKDLRITLLVMMVLQIVFTVVSLIAIVSLIPVLLYFLRTPPPILPALLVALVALLVLAAVSLVACAVTVIVYYAKLRRHYKNAAVAATN